MPRVGTKRVLPSFRGQLSEGRVRAELKRDSGSGPMIVGLANPMRPRAADFQRDGLPVSGRSPSPGLGRKRTPIRKTKRAPRGTRFAFSNDPSTA